MQSGPAAISFEKITCKTLSLLNTNNVMRWVRIDRMHDFDPCFVFVCRTSDVPEGQIVLFGAGDNKSVAIANVCGSFFAFDDRCTHGEASLSQDGQLTGHVIECGWHCGQFDVRTGRALTAPCTEDLRTYSVTVREGLLLVKKSELAALSG